MSERLGYNLPALGGDTLIRFTSSRTDTTLGLSASAERDIIGVDPLIFLQ